MRKNSNKNWQTNFLASQTHHPNCSSGIYRLICQGCIFHGPILCVLCSAPRFLLAGCFQMALHRPGTGTLLLLMRSHLEVFFLHLPSVSSLCFSSLLFWIWLPCLSFGIACFPLSASIASFTGVSVRIAVFHMWQLAPKWLWHVAPN